MFNDDNDLKEQELAALAALPNVTCKVSGVVTESDADNWTADDLQPYRAHGSA